MTFGISNLDVLRRPFILGLVGLGATILYGVVATTLAFLTTWPASIASLVGYTVSGVLSYLAHRRLTFRVEGSHGDAPWRFAALSAAGYGLAFAAPFILTDWLGYPVIVPVLLTCIGVPVVNAFALSRLVFRRPLIAPPKTGQP
jgi:putative flippase GtrA